MFKTASVSLPLLSLLLSFTASAAAEPPTTTLQAAAVRAAGLKEEIIFAEHAGGKKEDEEIRRWQVRARAADARPENFERLAWAYVAKARRTLDAGFYKLAERTLDVMDAKHGVSPDSQLLRGHILHNLHRFSEAEAIARGLTGTRGLPADFALLSDALVEEGKLVEAVEVLQRMVNVKPGAEAYSRISHVRWLRGDLPGAITAMETALRSTSTRDTDSYAWTLSRLAGFYLQAGDATRSLRVAESAVKLAAEYPPALLARGRALLALDRTAEAVVALQSAAELNPLPEYQWWLADALRAGGRGDEAAEVEKELKRRGETADPRTLALFLATRGEEAARAVALAREELSQRADVFTYDALAWALQARGDLPAADAEMRRALAAGTQDARLLWHAGEIARALGRAAEARELFANAKPLAATLTPSERARLGRHAVELARAD